MALFDGTLTDIHKLLFFRVLELKGSRRYFVFAIFSHLVVMVVEYSDNDAQVKQIHILKENENFNLREGYTHEEWTLTS
uniref:Uncharacterized protein n=1 Tax=Glossina palpalis gambiensis TaxID=67801 RepID=A0A1B0AWH8_9MUSC